MLLIFFSTHVQFHSRNVFSTYTLKQTFLRFCTPVPSSGKYPTTVKYIIRGLILLKLITRIFTLRRDKIGGNNIMGREGKPNYFITDHGKRAKDVETLEQCSGPVNNFQQIPSSTEACVVIQ